MTPDLTFVIPVFNEGRNLPRLWQELSTQVRLNFEAVIIYDFEEDDTVPVARGIAASGDSRLRLVKNRSQGVANALKTGFAAVTDNPIMVLMADLSDDLSILPQMLALHRQGYDVVAASRYMPGGRIENGPVIKQGLSRMAGLSLHYLRGIPTTDASNAFKLYSPAVFRTISLESEDGFEINVEITVKAWLHGFRFAEVPSVWRERTEGKSKFKLLKWLPKYLRWYVYAFRYAPVTEA